MAKQSAEEERAVRRVMTRTFRWRHAVVWGAWNQAVADVQNNQRILSKRSKLIRRIVNRLYFAKLTQGLNRYRVAVLETAWDALADEQSIRYQSHAISQLGRTFRLKKKNALRKAWVIWKASLDECARETRIMDRAMSRVLRLRQLIAWGALNLAVEELRCEERTISEQDKAVLNLTSRLHRSRLAQVLTQWRFATLEAVLGELTEEHGRICESRATLLFGHAVKTLRYSMLRSAWFSWVSLVIACRWEFKLDNELQLAEKSWKSTAESLIHNNEEDAAELRRSVHEALDKITLWKSTLRSFGGLLYKESIGRYNFVRKLLNDRAGSWEQMTPAEEQMMDEILQIWLGAAEKGNVHAQKRLGMLYERGEGVHQNFEEAQKWYDAANTSAKFSQDSYFEEDEVDETLRSGTTGTTASMTHSQRQRNMASSNDSQEAALPSAFARRF